MASDLSFLEGTKMTLGEKIKAAREQAGFTQAQFAEVLGVSRQAVTKWEADRGMPDVENLKLMSERLGISVDDLLDDSTVPELQGAGSVEVEDTGAHSRKILKIAGLVVGALLVAVLVVVFVVVMLS